MDIKVLEIPEFKPFTFNDSKSVYENLSLYGNADRELFLVLFMSSRNQVIKREVTSVGTINQAAVYPREIFKSALLNRAASIVCAHNHTSGVSTPSIEDDQMTKEIALGGFLLGIKLLDHLIIGKGSFYSYADEGRIGDFECDIRRHLAEMNMRRFCGG